MTTPATITLYASFLSAVLLSALAIGAVRINSIEQRPAPSQPRIWIQPPQVSAHYSDPISSHGWGFDYHPVATELATLAPERNNDFKWNSTTAAVLERAAATLPENLPEASIARIGFLSAQGMPQAGGAELAEALTGMIRYVHAKNQVTAPGTDSSSAWTGFKTLVALQDQHLGDVRAQQLFGEQRRISQHLLQRRAIQDDERLNSEQRRQALLELTEQFRATRSAGETP
jgi:hypothetical protein